MIDQLDNPVWWALNSGNRSLAIGNEHAKHFQAGISPFVGINQNGESQLRALKQLLGSDSVAAIFTTDKNLNPSPWKIKSRIDGFQMMFEGETPAMSTALSIVKLTEQHVPAMLELTQISPPGPFMNDTIRFGGYEGIFQGQLLVAMAGRRFHVGRYVEISAVCTHPAHTGKGYARGLIHNQIRQIQSDGNIPYMHVRADNIRAYQIYKDMGFVTRTEMIIYILEQLK